MPTIQIAADQLLEAARQLPPPEFSRAEVVQILIKGLRNG